MKKLAIASALLSTLAFVGTGTAHAYQAEVGGSYTYMTGMTMMQLISLV